MKNEMTPDDEPTTPEKTEPSAHIDQYVFPFAKEKMDDIFGALFPDLIGDECVNIRLWGSKEAHPRNFYVKTPAEAGRLIDQYSKEKTICWGPGIRSRKDGTKDAVARVWAIWADVDTKHFKSKADALDRLNHLLHQPSIIVDSGGGYHAYWLLAEPVSGDDLKQAERAMQIVHGSLGLDKVHDVSRILRMPGSWNLKPSYPEPRPVKIVTFKPERRYSLKDFIPPQDGIVPPAAVDVTRVGGGFHDDLIVELLIPYWVSGKRNSLALALSGFMANVGLPLEKASQIIETLAHEAKDEESPSRLRTCEQTYARLTAGQKIRGRSALKEILSAADLEKLLRAFKRASPGVAPKENWLISAEDLLKTEFPPEQWLVEQLWSESACGIIGGPPKTGKTWVGLEMAVSIATGTKVFGRFSVPQPGPVIYIAGEDQRRYLKPRLELLLAGKGLTLTGLGGALHLATERFVLDSDEWKKTLRETCASLRPRALFLDPFIRMHHADENSSTELTPVLGFLRDLQAEYNCSILVVHHFRKPRTPGVRSNPENELRGSGDLYGWLDSAMYLQPFKEEGTVSITLIDGDHRNALAPESFHLSREIDEKKILLTVCDTPPVSSIEEQMFSRIREFLNEKEGRSASRQDIIEGVSGKQETLAQALKLLTERGLLKKTTEKREGKDHKIRDQVIYALIPEELTGEGAPASVTPAPTLI